MFMCKWSTFFKKCSYFNVYIYIFNDFQKIAFLEPNHHFFVYSYLKSTPRGVPQRGVPFQNWSSYPSYLILICCNTPGLADKPYSGMGKEDVLRFSNTPFWNNLRLGIFVSFGNFCVWYLNSFNYPFELKRFEMSTYQLIGTRSFLVARSAY